MPLLLLLIPIWLALVVLVLAACRAAARSERTAERSAAEMPVASFPGVTVWDSPDEQAATRLASSISGTQRARIAPPVRTRRRARQERASEPTVGSRPR
jgi:hypothetical protein